MLLYVSYHNAAPPHLGKPPPALLIRPDVPGKWDVCDDNRLSVKPEQLIHWSLLLLATYTVGLGEGRSFWLKRRMHICNMWASHLCPLGGIRFFPGLWCEDSREVNPGPRCSHQMETGADSLIRNQWGSCKEDSTKPPAGSWCPSTTGNHISDDRLWRPGGGAADPDLYCARYHMWGPAVRSSINVLYNTQTM